MKFDDPKEVLAKADDSGLRRVLVVTALPLEMAAVRKFTKHIASCQSRDGNVFELGHFVGSGSDWLVVVGESGAGNHQASQMVTHACSQFGPFELIVLVGVAATRKADDAPIGSVVAAEHVYWPYVGKYKEGEFQGRPRDIPINRQLLGLVKKVARDERWHERLVPPYGGIIPKDDLYPKPFPPTAKIAQIVSVESVSTDADSSLENHITADYQDATALEMEGYGAMFAAFNEETPCVVVRGISDDRAGKDPALDKIHQPIAAAHGAAFAYEVLDLWGENRRPPDARPLVSRPASGPINGIPASSTGTSGTATEVTSESRDENVTTLSQRSAGTTNTLTLVLSFAGEAPDFPPEKQQQLLEAVRKVTGNQTAEIVGAEAGSFHLFVRVAYSDLVKLRSAQAKSLFLQECDADLIGVATKNDFDAASSDTDTLLKASAAVLNWPRILPDGTSIERPELSQLLEITDDEFDHTKAVLGDPGSGKTALLAALSHELRARDIPFLAVKADILDVSTATEQDLQFDLGLPDLPSRMLERLSYRGPVFLIIDQLDALAGYVDLRTGRLSVLLNLVRALGMRRNVHIVLSARRFEYEHDTRLKSVRAESIHLELPPWSVVLQILEANGVQAAGWPGDAQQVMRSPQSLATFLRLANPTQAEPFSKYQQMLERLWSERILGRPNGHRLSKLAGAIAEDMADRETLWLAGSRYDNDVESLKTLLAEQILTTPPGAPGSIGFSHQTVFEFALARAFAQQEGRLSGYVRERTTSLFIRPKLWAALTYLRAVEPTAYQTELVSIWSIPGLRLHLRHLLIEFLGQQPEPAGAEIDVLMQAITSEDRRAALQAIAGSKGWFAHFKNTEIAKAMRHADEANIATFILSRALEFSPDDVLALVEKHWLPDEQFDGFAWHILQDTVTWLDAHLTIATIIVERTDISPFAFDHMVSTIGANQPLMAIKLVRILLDKMLSSAKKDADESFASRSNGETEQSEIERFMDSPAKKITKLVEQSDGWDGLEALAKSDPVNFIAFIWPWFHEVFEQIKRYKGEEGSELSFQLPYALDYRFQDEGTLDLPEPSLLTGIRAASETLAAQDPAAFRAWLQSEQGEDAMPAQRLFAHTLATRPQQYAPDALAFVLTDSRRFALGSIEDSLSTTKRLIGAVSSYWGPPQIEQFVQDVIAFAPRPAAHRDAKGRQFFYQYVERVRFELLRSLSTTHLPLQAETLIKEGERKFGDTKLGATFTGPTWVGSSMSAEAINLASDDEVLHAFEALPDATGWDNPKHWLKGGNIQLSRSFADFEKKQPERAVDIIRQFTPDIGARAAGYAIDALGEIVDGTLIEPLIKELDNRGFSSEEFRGGVARGIEKLINRDIVIHDETLAVLEGWLSSHAVREIQDSSENTTDEEDEEVSEKDESRTESILWGMGGMTILPHGNFPVLEAIARILLQRKDYTTLLKILTDHLSRPEDEKVWTALFRLFPFIRSDDKTALADFYRLLFEKYPRLSTRRETAILLAQLQWMVPDFVHDTLAQWATQSSPFVQQAYGELVALIWLVRPNLEWPDKLMKDILGTEPSAPVRTGSAFAAIHVWAEADDKIKVANLIRDLVKNASDETWTAIVDLFRLVDEITPDADWVQILQAIGEQIPHQPRFMSTFIIERLQTLLPHEADLVASISRSLVEKWQSDLGDMRTSGAAVAPELVDIAITLHRLGPPTRGETSRDQCVCRSRYSESGR